MNYLYYPGCCCAFKASGKAYQESLLEIMRIVGIPRKDLDDWNCCGATMYMAIDEMQAYGMAARNLALAEEQSPGQEAHLITPCSACYAVFNKTKHFIEEQPQHGATIRNALKQADMSYGGRVRIRHPLDVLVNDVGLDTIRRHVKQPLRGLKVACYYGCLLTRPYAEFDSNHHPQTMDRLMEAVGAEPIDWPLKTRCCGGSMTGTVEGAGLRLSYIILNEAERRGADIIATACPFCQTNLECFQQRIRTAQGRLKTMPTAFFTQLVGLALGVPRKNLGFHRLFVPFRYPPATKSSKEVLA